MTRWGQALEATSPARSWRHTAAVLAIGACLFFLAVGITPTGGDLLFVAGTDVAAASPPAETSTSTSTPAPTSSPTSSSTTSSTTIAPLVVPTSPDQWFAPSGRNGGTEGLITFLANLAIRDNALAYNSEPTPRTSGSDLSDHHVSRTDSWAADVAVRGVQVPTSTTDTAARRIASALGQPDWTGGDLTKTINGYRFQVLWKVAGHFNHVHVGVRKI